MDQENLDNIVRFVEAGRLRREYADSILNGMLDCAEANRRRAAEDAARVARAIEALRGGTTDDHDQV